MRRATRRGLLGAAAALMSTPVLASATTLPAAGRVPDADLILVCAEFDAAEAKVRAIFNGPNAIADDGQAEMSAVIERGQMAALLDRMGELQAETSAGIQARAHTFALHNGDFAFGFDDETTVSGRLLAYLLRDAAALSGSGDFGIAAVAKQAAISANCPRNS